MANRISEIVSSFAEMVKQYALSAQESAANKKLTRALLSLSDAIGEGQTVEIGENELRADDFDELANVLKSQESDSTAVATELAKRATRVTGYVEDEVLDEDDLAIATDALALWNESKPSARMYAVRGTTSQGRVSTPDFEFPIFAISEDGTVIETGARSGVTDWNSLRHYTQRHASKVTGSEKFSPFVSTQWQNAKRAFMAGEHEVEIEGDESSPNVTLQRQEVASQVG